MKITHVETIPLCIPIKRTHKISSFTLNNGYFLLVKVDTDEGITGFGEASLSMGPVFPDETLRGAKSIVEEVFSSLLIGRNPFNHEAIMKDLDRAALRNTTVKTSVELALFDIMGKKLEVPVYNLLGGIYRDSVPVSWSIAMGDVDKEIEEMKEKISQGHHIFKIKFGFLSPEEDMFRLEKIKEAVNPETDIRIDVNQGWTPDVAIPTIRQIEKKGYQVTFIEQPVANWDIRGMARINQAVETPIMADESLFSIFDAQNIINTQAADIFALKIMKHGGLKATQKVAALAESANIPCYVGSNLETGIATLASLHVALSTEIIRYGCELFGPLLLSDDILKNPIIYSDGQLRVPEGDGLGAEIDFGKVDQYRFD